MSTERTLAAIASILTCAVGAFSTNSAIAVTIASDNASNPAYADGWQAEDNGGTGFGAWVFAFSGDGSGLFHDPQFIDNGPLASNSLGAPAFALTTGDKRSAFETSEVRRTLNVPIAAGQTLSADVDGSALDSSAPAFTIGNTFDLFGTNGSERFSLFTNNEYHNGSWTATGDANTGIPAGSSFHIEFTLVTVNTYNLVLSPIGGGTALFTQTGASLAGTAGVGINRIRITAYGTGSSANGSKEIFFDNLSITGPDSLLGDYNRNGVVDAADYVVWRDTLHEAGIGLAADGNGNGEVDAGDYTVWRSNFGATTNMPAPASLAIPEPATWLTTTVILLGIVFVRNRHISLSSSHAARTHGPRLLADNE